MERISIVELLIHCPKGMELNCTKYGECILDSVSEGELYPIKITKKSEKVSIRLTRYGSVSYDRYSECIIFPKGKTTWEGFMIPCEFEDESEIW